MVKDVPFNLAGIIFSVAAVVSRRAELRFHLPVIARNGNDGSAYAILIYICTVYAFFRYGGRTAPARSKQA